MSSSKDTSKAGEISKNSQDRLQDLLNSPILQGIAAVLAIIGFLFGETSFVRFLIITCVIFYIFANRKRLTNFLKSIDLDSIRYYMISKIKSANLGEILAIPFIILWWFSFIIFVLSIIVSIIAFLISSREAFVDFLINSAAFIREEVQLLLEPVTKAGVMPNSQNLRATSVAILFLVLITIWLTCSNISNREILIEARQYLDQFNEDILSKIKSDWSIFLDKISDQELHKFLQACHAYKFSKGVLIIVYESHELYRVSQKRGYEIKRELNSYFGNHIKNIEFMHYSKVMDYCTYIVACDTFNSFKNSDSVD